MLGDAKTLNVNINNRFTRIILNQIQHYNHKKYWNMRQEVINPKSKVHKIKRLYYLLRIKRMDAFNNASMGTDLGRGAHFETTPILIHGLNGIIISPYAKIGKNCVIHQQVTIAGLNGVSSEIGDSCMIGAGAKILQNVKVGNNVFIGANAVVTKDIPDNCVVGGVPAKIIKQL